MSELDNILNTRIPLLAGGEYIPSTKTDVRKTFSKFGWVPPSQQEGYKPNIHEVKKSTPIYRG
jgi:hypothetical protein